MNRVLFHPAKADRTSNLGEKTGAGQGEVADYGVAAAPIARPRRGRVNAGINSIGNASVTHISLGTAYDRKTWRGLSALGSASDRDFLWFGPDSMLMDCFRWRMMAAET